MPCQATHIHIFAQATDLEMLLMWLFYSKELITRRFCLSLHRIDRRGLTDKRRRRALEKSHHINALHYLQYQYHPCCRYCIAFSAYFPTFRWLLIQIPNHLSFGSLLLGRQCLVVAVPLSPVCWCLWHLWILSERSRWQSLQRQQPS
jgi:hypothetical protein